MHIMVSGRMCTQNLGSGYPQYCGEMALYTIFIILLTLWNSEQKNGLLKIFFVFHPILMKLGEVVVDMGTLDEKQKKISL